jgi:glycosyltransferase involved in cell wall biosynthesis
MISCFMIAKDLLGQGYPFVEAIASALPICDEFLISDGYSTDGTYEILQKIADLNTKVKVHRYHWPDKKDITVLADVTNEVRSKCRCDYIFSLQANEVIHEQSAPLIKALPSMFPDVETFSFPYVQLLNKYKLTEEFRLRFSKNLPHIVAEGDAWKLGTSKQFERTKKLRAFAYPPRLMGYLTDGIWFTYANSAFGPFSRAVYLPKPIFRYWSLFPKNFVKKYQKHKELLCVSGFEESAEKLQEHADDSEKFWKMGSEILRQSGFKERIQYPEAFNSIEKSEHPAVVREFISNSDVAQYYVREELFEMLKKLM